MAEKIFKVVATCLLVLAYSKFGVQAGSTDCKTNGGGQANHACVFPFRYKGIVYNECTYADHTKPWCSTEVDSQESYISGKWGTCGSDCPVGEIIVTSANCKINLRVKPIDHQNGKPTYVVVTDCHATDKENGWAMVKFENGTTWSYRIGEDNKYDLYLFDSYKEEVPNKLCKNSFMSVVQNQLEECKILCTDTSGCVGISYSHKPTGLCFLCMDEILSDAVLGYGFYKKNGCTDTPFWVASDGSNCKDFENGVGWCKHYAGDYFNFPENNCCACGKSDACNDLDNGKTDSGGDGCEWYDANKERCGDFDDDDFKANEFCCSCKK